MITEFTCGIYTATFEQHRDKMWIIKTNSHVIARIDKDGLLIKFTPAYNNYSSDDLIEICVLMNNIKRQYKQLQS